MNRIRTTPLLVVAEKAERAASTGKAYTKAERDQGPLDIVLACPRTVAPSASLLGVLHTGLQPHRQSASGETMNHMLNLRRHQHLIRHGVRYRIIGRAKDGRVNLMNVNDETMTSASDSELADDYADGLLAIDRRPVSLSARAQSLLDGDLAELPEKTRNEAEFRLPFVNAMLSNGSKRWSNSAIASLIKSVFAANHALRPELFDSPPSVRTVRRWTNRAMELGFTDVKDLRTLLPRNHACGGRYDRFPAEVMTLMDGVIDDLIMRPTPTTTREAYEHFAVQARTKVSRLGPRVPSLQLPSLRTFQRRVASISDNEISTARYGLEEANRRHGLVGRGPQGEHLLHEVEIDHTVADIIIVSEDTGLPIGRPNLTTAVDRWSRMIVGVHIGFEPAGWRSVMLCLRNSILPKSVLLNNDPAELRATGRWPAMGIMDKLITDNGPEFHSASLQHALQELGITLQYSRAAKPGDKGKIERLFRRMNVELFHQLPGTTFSNPKHRHTYDSEKQAALTLPQLRALLHRWIVDVYCNKPHSTTKQTPGDRWMEGVRARPVTLPASTEALMKALAFVEYRRLTRKGIELYGLHYCDRENKKILAMLNDPGLPAAVKVKVNPDDLGAVHIEDFRSPGRYIEVPCTNPDYARGLTRAEHDIICTRVRNQLKTREHATMQMLVDARASIRAAAAKLREEKRLTSKKLHAAIPATDGLTDLRSKRASIQTTREPHPHVATVAAQRPAQRMLPREAFVVEID